MTSIIDLKSASRLMNYLLSKGFDKEDIERKPYNALETLKDARKMFKRSPNSSEIISVIDKLEARAYRGLVNYFGL